VLLVAGCPDVLSAETEDFAVTLNETLGETLNGVLVDRICIFRVSAGGNSTLPLNYLYNCSMLQVNHLTCEREHRVLFENVSFAVQGGELLRVQGGNGAGKTTLLRILCGLYEEYEGEINWETEQYPLYIGHKPGVKDQLTALENLAWLSRLAGNEANESLLSKALSEVNLDGYEEVLCGSMSEGQRKRVNLARLFLSPPEVLILDEPFSAIDVAGVSRLEEIMGQHLKHGGVIILTSHQAVNIDTKVRSLTLGVSD
jgi:heme exporter protein A